MSGYLLAKYNTQTTFVFPVVKRAVVDLAVSADWTPATGDTKVSKDGGNVANTTNNPAAVGGTGSALWSLTLTATELSAAEIVVQIVDSATKAVEDQVLRIYTYGNASAKFVADFSVAAVGAVMPTVAGRTLDIAATGEAGIDLDNVLLTNGSHKTGVKASGTLSGTHSTTTADLGTNAPADDIGGCVLVIPTRGVYNMIDSYNTSTGVATFSPALGSATLTDGDQWYVFFGARASTGAPPAVNMTQLGGDAQSATDLKDFADAGYDPATNKVQGVVLTDTLTTYTGNTPQTGDSFARIGATGSGLTSLASQASVNTIDDFLDTEMAATLAAVDTEVAAILALLDDARGEPGQGTPPVNPDLATKIDYLYKSFRNRITQTATTFAIYADDGTTIDHKATVADDGTTFSRTELTTGP